MRIESYGVQIQAEFSGKGRGLSFLSKFQCLRNKTVSGLKIKQNSPNKIEANASNDILPFSLE
jgi:hypothetical protein